MQIFNQHGIQDQEIFRNHEDYWQVADNIRNIYMSGGALSTLLDFERVLDEIDLYAFRNWSIGELVEGPDIGRYKITCLFMWPEKLMPDPRGARRLLPFDCSVLYRKVMMKVPMRIDDPDDFRPGTKKARIIERPVWLVEISIPKHLMSEIRTGSIEMEGEEIDLEELDSAYEQDLDKEEYQNDDQQEQAQQAQQAQQQPM